jgi:hypothetical protein
VTPARALCAAALAIAAGCSSSTPPAAKTPPKDTAPKIAHFYASPGNLPRGERATVCYGVENTASVRLEPPVEALTPSFNRCFQVSPTTTTEYTLTATSSDGKQVSQSFTISVGAAAPSIPKPSQAALILFFTPSANQVQPGRPVTLCYGVKGAVRVSLKPNVRAIEPLERSCFAMTFHTTSTLTLTAVDAVGGQDSESVTIKVAP